MEKMLVNGIQSNSKTAQISVMKLKDEPGVAAKLFGAIAKEGLNVELILQSIGGNGTKDISFVVLDEDADAVVEVLKKTFSKDDYNEIKVDKNMGIVSIRGAGMKNTSLCYIEKDGN